MKIATMVLTVITLAKTEIIIVTATIVSKMGISNRSIVSVVMF